MLKSLASPPPTMKLIISSGSFLTLVALVCLIVISSTTSSVHTSDIQERQGDNLAAAAVAGEDNRTASQASDTTATSASGQIVTGPQATPPTVRRLQASDSRTRGGRSYQPHTGQQSMPLESYAAAYAAANSGAGADQSLTQQTVAAGPPSASDASAYTSFGEAPPPPSSAGSQSVSSASLSRQLSSPSDYASPEHHSNFFAGHMAPSSNEISYSAGHPAGSYYGAPSNHHHHHHQYHKSSQQAAGLPLGYPTNAYERYPMSSSYYDRMAHSSPALSPVWSTSGFGLGGGGGALMSSASHALSHWTNGFSITEIICGLVAIAIGAIILGAPFFLIYLALMGNFSGSGTLSLTNPTSATGAAGGASTPANGRRKRLAVFEAMNIGEQSSHKHPELASIIDSVAKSVSPFVDLQQVSRTFKQLVSSVEKYANTAQSEHTRRAKQSSS